MKRISAAQLVEAARSMGATLELDDATINAEGAKTPAASMLRRVPPPAAPPPPMRVDMDTSALVAAAQAGERRADQLARLVAALITEMRTQSNAAPAPIVGWDFVLERKDGRLCGIQATAVR